MPEITSLHEAMSESRVDVKYVYFFGSGKAEGTGAMKDQLGGKGAGLARDDERRRAGAARLHDHHRRCRHYHAQGRKLPSAFEREQHQALGRLEGIMGKRLGDATDPLLVSVRSGAKFSMPGMMDTVLNLGLNDRVGRGARPSHRQPALRLGLLPALHPDVRRRWCWVSRSTSSRR